LKIEIESHPPPPPTYTDLLSLYLPQRGGEREREEREAVNTVVLAEQGGGPNPTRKKGTGLVNTVVTCFWFL
jgi:hypothetical protein